MRIIAFPPFANLKRTLSESKDEFRFARGGIWYNAHFNMESDGTRGGEMPYAEIVRLVWPLALGMVNNAVMQFVDRAYLAHSSPSTRS